MPAEVAAVCRLTYACTVGDIHLTDEGAATVAGVLATAVKGAGIGLTTPRIGGCVSLGSPGEDDPAFGLVDGAGEKIAEITGDPLYQRIELTGRTYAVDDVRLLAPVIPRSKVIGIGKNYHDHAAEMGGEAPAEPLMFLIPNTAVVSRGIRW